MAAKINFTIKLTLAATDPHRLCLKNDAFSLPDSKVLPKKRSNPIAAKVGGFG